MILLLTFWHKISVLVADIPAVSTAAYSVTFVRKGYTNGVFPKLLECAHYISVNAMPVIKTNVMTKRLSVVTVEKSCVGSVNMN